MSVTLVMLKEPVMEGGSIITECAANSNPQPHLYLWRRRHMGQINEINSTQRKTSFSDIRRDTSLSCIAHNTIGEEKSSWLDLDVQCKTSYRYNLDLFRTQSGYEKKKNKK